MNFSSIRGLPYSFFIRIALLLAALAVLPLASASWDRLLQRLGKAQRFGTQYRRSGKAPWTMEPLDTSIPDSVRAEYGVPTLEESRKRLEEWNSKP